MKIRKTPPAELSPEIRRLIARAARAAAKDYVSECWQGLGKTGRGECGRNVFPDHPEWGITCNQDIGHAPPCARFSVPASGTITCQDLGHDPSIHNYPEAKDEDNAAQN